MTIQTPNLFVAGALVDPAELPSDPFLSSDGFQEFDPSGTPGNPLGGFTQLATGQYLMKMTQGLASGEGSLHASPLDSVFTTGTLFPFIEGGNPEEDGQSIGVLQTDVDGTTPIEIAFTIAVFRFNTGSQVDFP